MFPKLFSSILLIPSQIISHFGIPRFIHLVMHPHIYYVSMHSKIHKSRNAKIINNLGWRE